MKCAIVGNSSILLDQEYGKFIDEHDIVIRFNRAKTKNFEKYAGSKTNLRFCNSQIIGCFLEENSFKENLKIFPEWDNNFILSVFLPQSGNCGAAGSLGVHINSLCEFIWTPGHGGLGGNCVPPPRYSRPNTILLPNFTLSFSIIILEILQNKYNFVFVYRSYIGRLFM